MDTGRHRVRAARQRQESRQKRQSMAIPQSEANRRQSSLPTVRLPDFGKRWIQVLDFLWYIRHHTPAFRIGAGLLAIAALLFVLGTIFSPVVGYNVWALNTPLAGLSLDEANRAIQTTWNDRIRIQVYLEGNRLQTITPSQLGLTLDSGTMAQQAMDVRWQGFPMGYEIAPIIDTDFATAQSYLLGLVDTVYVPSYDAGFAWRDNQLVGVPGTPSRELDIMLVLENITRNPAQIVRTGRLDLLTKATPPNSIDATPYLADAQRFIEQNFRLIGYDPFTNETTPWTSTREEIARWLAVGPRGLTVREPAFRAFLEAINGQLRSEGQRRYLDPREAITQLQAALDQVSDRAYLRVRYEPTTLEVQRGDWGQRIARRMGLPFGLIAEVNPNVNWNQLAVGTVINLPTRDLVVPITPVPNKRIVVDLDRRYLVAYENGEVVMSWRVSIGRRDAPTIPGVFQILSHAEKAYGSGFSLCGDAGCSQWEMSYFMGIYEISPGLMNGFHGAVLLPNGAYLDDGQIGNASTFGCVMGNNEQSRQLFEWAEKGTMVEIISSEFPPQSDIGRKAMDYISRTYGV